MPYVTEKGKNGNMRYVNAVNSSKMVIKNGVVFYRQVKGMKGEKLE